MNNTHGPGKPNIPTLAHSFKKSLMNNRFAYIAFNVLSFTMTALIAYYISGKLDASRWFSIIFGVSVGMLVFCAVRLWLDEDSFDDPDTKSYIVLSGTLSFVGVILAYITLRTFPFGEHTVLIIDMHHQYVAFFALLREKLTSGGSLLYSDSLGLGSGFIPLFAYYLSSPFNILTLIFPREYLTEAVELITVLKITAGGVTAAIFAKHMFRRNNFFIVICGVMYSLMSFYVCHSWNIMWLDALALLPLVFLGLSKLLFEGKPLLYCVTLAMTLICSYYMGYMICVYLVVAFAAFVLADNRALSASDRAQRFWRFCYASVIGGGISAFMTVPAFLYLRQTSGAEDKFARAMASNFDLFALVQRALYGSYPSMRGDNLPNIYCTVLAFLLFFTYALCKAIPLRRRIAWCGAASVVAVCMSINWTNFAWHGFHFPNDLPYRFSYLLSFTMVFIAMQLLSAIDRVRSDEIVKSALVAVGLIFMEQQFGDGKSDFIMIYGSIAFVLVYSLILLLKTSGRIRRSICWALVLIVVFIEAGTNASSLLVQLDRNEYYTERNDFVSDYEIKKNVVSTVESYDDPAARMEIIPRKTCNDPSLFGYSGLTVFASSNRKSVTTLMGKLGYAINGVNSYLYKNFTPVSDSMLGLKYVVLNKQINSHRQLTPLDEVDADSTVDGVTTTDTAYIHLNEYALSRAYMVDRGVLSWTWDSSNPFAVQNSLVSCATGLGDVYQQIYLYKNGSGSDFYDNYDVYAGYTSPSDVEDTGLSISEFNCTFDINGTFFSSAKVSEALDSSFTATQELKEPGQYYVYVDCRAAESINVATTTADGDTTTISSSPNEPNIIDLGYMDAGSSVSVNFDSEITCSGNIFLARLDQDIFEQAMAQLNSCPLEIEKYSEGHISGIVNADRDGMMFTSVPYDSGWTVKVDGKKVAPFALGDALLCFAVPQGTHTVTMDYFPSGFVAGIIISIIFLLALLTLCIPSWNRKARALIDRFILQPMKDKYAEKRAAAAAAAIPAGTAAAADLLTDDFPDTDTDVPDEARTADIMYDDPEPAEENVAGGANRQTPQ